MLRIESLGKQYGDYPLFQGLNLRFGPGCVALCEEESTGKTTFLSIVAGQLSPTQGDVWIGGYSMRTQPEAAKARLAYIPEDCMLYPHMTGRELLEKVAAEKGVTVDQGILDLAVQLELEPHLEKRFEQMSTGTRRKVYLTAAALGEPEVVIADGPTNGVDSRACSVLIDVFRRWSQDRVVLFASYDAQFVSACRAQPLALRRTEGQTS